MDSKELMEIISKLSVKVADLEKRVFELENDESFSGVYLDGTPDFVKEYINNTNNKKDGE